MRASLENAAGLTADGCFKPSKVPARSDFPPTSAISGRNDRRCAEPDGSLNPSYAFDCGRLRLIASHRPRRRRADAP